MFKGIGLFSPATLLCCGIFGASLIVVLHQQKFQHHGFFAFLPSLVMYAAVVAAAVCGAMTLTYESPDGS
jgi:Na+-transporting NADH:ubiquinone oxidoreductase subunit NqrE